LHYILSQKLIPCDNEQRRVLAAEILAVTPAVRALIRAQKAHQINTAMQTGYALGMRTMNQSLQNIVEDGHISLRTALQYTDDKKGLRETVDDAYPPRSK
jgi:twitching motility protein PilT